jgi:hypothetical protein
VVESARRRVTLLVIPAAELALISHHGSLADADLSYARLGSYAITHEISIDGPLREYYRLFASGDTSPSFLSVKRGAAVGGARWVAARGAAGRDGRPAHRRRDCQLDAGPRTDQAVAAMSRRRLLKQGRGPATARWTAMPSTHPTSRAERQRHWRSAQPACRGTCRRRCENGSSDRLFCLAADRSEIGAVTPRNAPLDVARGRAGLCTHTALTWGNSP